MVLDRLGKGKGYWVFARFIPLLVLLVGWGCSSESENPPLLSHPLGKVEKVEGDVQLFKPGARGGVRIHLGDSLSEGDVLSTEGGGMAVVRLGEVAEFSIRSGSRTWINPRILGEKENPSMVLQRGRLSVRSLEASQLGSPLLETAMLRVEAKGTDFEVAVAEDLGVLLCVYKGRVEMAGPLEPMVVPEKHEAEVDFLDGASGMRKLKERTEADWAAWMAARFRNMSGRFPELATRMDRCLRETGTRRLETRKLLDEKAQELQRMAQGIAQQGNTKGTPSGSTGESALDVARSQARLILETRHLENRTEILLGEADRLRKRGQAMKKELGERFSPADDLLRLIIDGGKVLRGSISEERQKLLEHSQKWRENLAMAGLLSVASLEIPKETKPEPAQASKPKTSPPQAKASPKPGQEEKKARLSAPKASKPSQGVSRAQPSAKGKLEQRGKEKDVKTQPEKKPGSPSRGSSPKTKQDTGAQRGSKKQ